MIVLHAAQTEMGFLLWGESPSASSTSSVPSSASAADSAVAEEDTAPALALKRAAKTKAVSPAPSPFDAGQAALDAALVEHLGLSPGGARPLEAIAWLPSSRSGPVPSSRLLHDVEYAGKTIHLLPWRVSATLLDAQEAVTALANCTGKQTLARGVFWDMTSRIGRKCSGLPGRWLPGSNICPAYGWSAVIITPYGNR